jgi:O-antigen/teichoic acid export membrane protein
VTISWWGEIWPIQWKIALSWVSGYFIFQLFNPVLFHYHGAVVAGQMGMTLSATNALLAVSISLVNSSSPDFGKLVVVREWKALDNLFYKVLCQSIALVLPGALAGWGIIRLLQLHSGFGQRFIPASQAAFLLAAVCLLTIVYAFAVYLRAHKEEPLVYLSLITALSQGGATWLLGKFYTSNEVALGFLCINLVSLPFVYLIWQRSRRLWHTPVNVGESQRTAV